jgi:uncharacterized membrane protein
MWKDVAFIAAVLLIAEVVAGFAILKILRRKKDVDRREAELNLLDRVEELYVQGKISIDEYNDAIETYWKRKKEHE